MLERYVAGANIRKIRLIRGPPKEEFISETTHEARYPLDEFTRKCIEIVLSKFPDGYIEVIYPGIKL